MAVESKIIYKNGIPYKVTLEVTRLNEAAYELDECRKVKSSDLDAEDKNIIKDAGYIAKIYMNDNKFLCVKKDNIAIYKRDDKYLMKTDEKVSKHPELKEFI